MRVTITIKDWHWDESIKNMVFEDESGQKYKGKAHNVGKGKVYLVDAEDTHSKDGYISINKWL